MPRPVGTRRAAKRAAYRRQHAGQLELAGTARPVANSSHHISVHADDSKEQFGQEVVQEVIQEVVHESQKVAATISENVYPDHIICRVFGVLHLRRARKALDLDEGPERNCHA